MKDTGRYKLVIVALVAVNVLIIAFWWMFYTPDKPGSERKRGNWHDKQRNFIEQTLNFDDSQKMQFDQLDKDHKKRLFDMNNKVDSLKREIGKVILSGESDNATVDSLFSDIANGRAAIDTTIYHHFRRLRGICRPDQVAAFDSVMTEFFNRKNRGPSMNRNMPEPGNERPPQGQ